MRAAFVAAAACACSSMGVYPSATNRSIFASKTYSTDPPKEIDSNVAMQLFAQLQLETSGRFYSPQKAAACLSALDGCYLAALGETLAKATSVDAWAWDLKAQSLPNACDADVDARDRTMLRYVVGRIATVTEAVAENTVRTRRDRSMVFDRATAALALLAPIVAKTPAPPAGGEDIVEAPALALSGGSANGAFTAGFLFELLSARERVLHTKTNRDERVALDRKERFGVLAGTSVGSLISQVLDLYFVDESQPITAPQQKALDECVAWWGQRKPDPTASNPACFDGWPEPLMTGPVPQTDMRLPQACALTKLYRYFTDVEEGDLMCVEPGSITQMLGALGQPRPNMMRFDPMQTNIIDPVLHDFGPLLLNNSTTRVVVSVQMEQNQTVGLDERACMLAADPNECLGSGVMASVVLPFFARPVRAVTTGFDSRGHDCGTWFDGGLRSGFPVYRALRMTRPLEIGSPRARVLAIATSRLFDLPSDRPINLMDVAMNAVGQMSNQNFLSEPEIAQQSEEHRQRAMAILQGKTIPSASGSDAGGAVNHSRVPESFQSVVTVYVPTETPPQLIAESGYSFDRYVMRGLFVWGRREAIRRLWIGKMTEGERDIEPLCERLGWMTIGDKAQPFLIQDAKDLMKWSHAYTQTECPKHRETRMQEGHDRVSDDKRVHTCAAIGSKKEPSYFACPNP